jgi:nucleotide-binding universal stress UspA family protein
VICFKKILVPVDFSEPSKKAVTYGLSLAEQFDAKLIIAHIVPESTALLYAFPTELTEVEKEQYAKAKNEINNLVPADRAVGLNLQTIVKIGNVESEVLGIVKDEAIDLVVLGTHGRRRLGRWFIGSVTEHMLRKVPVPVLTVSHLEPERHDVGLVSLRRILYATDLSESSITGFQHAIEFARANGATLTVMHAIDDEDRLLWGPAWMAHLDRAKLTEQMRNRLDELVERAKPSEIQIKTLVLEGKPFRKILEVAENYGMDIIVLNLQSKGVLERALLGSTAERVVRLASVPVLSVPFASGSCTVEVGRQSGC